MRNLIYLFLAALIITPVLADGDKDDTQATKSLVRHRTMTQIVQILSTEAMPERERSNVLVCWLIDNNATMVKNDLHEEIASSIVSSFRHFEEERLRMAVVGLGENPELVCPITRDLDEVADSIRALTARPDDAFKNTMDGMRIAATAMKEYKGEKILVLMTLENGDNEDDIELTRKLLEKYEIKLEVVSLEAIYSDPWWQVYGGSYKNMGFDLYGAETPYREYPAGWLYDPLIYSNTVPSGFGFYGLAHLAAETGGKYFLYAPPAEGQRFCKTVRCPFCNSTHTECDAIYDPMKLGTLQPSVESRKDYESDMRKEKLYHATAKAWEIAYKTGVCGNEPPLLSKGSTVVDSEGKINKNNRPTYYPNGDWKGLKSKALKGIKELDKAISQLKKAIGVPSRDSMPTRVEANAESLLIHLSAARFNLGQLTLLCDGMIKLDKAKPAAADAFAKPKLEKARGKKVTTYMTDTLYFCHGGDRMKNIGFLGGKDTRKELLELCELVDKTSARYNETPWELIVRRAGLVLFRPVIPVPVKPLTPEERKRQRERSKTQQKTTQTKNPAKPANTGRPQRPNRGGSSDGGGSTSSGGR
jgi:hypothetical protein